MTERADGHEEQLRHGTFRENLLKLQTDIADAVSAGGGDAEDYQATLVQLLKAVEGLRVKQEQEIHRLDRQRAFHEATIRNCSQFANLILSVVVARKNEVVRARAAEENRLTKELDEAKLLLEDAQAAEDEGKIQELEHEIASIEQEIEDKQEERQEDAKVVHIPIGSRQEKAVLAQAVGEIVAQDHVENVVPLINVEGPSDAAPEPEPEEPGPREATVRVKQKPTSTKKQSRSKKRRGK
jgi:hypothetical protein